MSSEAKGVVTKFWETMQTNDFLAASELLAPNYELYWPQSSEKISGRANFVAVNRNYPANGPWRFTLNKILGDGNEVVTDVSVTDGVVAARALTFSTVENGLIVKQVEYWPDPFEPAAWRRAWVERD